MQAHEFGVRKEGAVSGSEVVIVMGSSPRDAENKLRRLYEAALGSPPAIRYVGTALVIL